MRALPLAALIATACSPTSGDVGPDATCPASQLVGTCEAMETEVCPETVSHVDPGTQIEWGSNPPASGVHYTAWGRWGRQDVVLPRGYWVHNLEHGGVVLLWNCPSGCPEVVAGLQRVSDALPDDPLCDPAIRVRTVITPDPLLPAGVQVAASAWGFTYTASCFDETSLSAFAQEHYNHSPENTCGDGWYPP